MAKLTIDMSGRAGVANSVNISARQNYSAEEGQVIPDASTFGSVYSPFLRPGYLSPANGTLSSVTLATTQNAPMSASAYDPVNDDIYFAERGQQLFKGDTSSDTALDLAVDLGASAIIHDIEFYMVNGVRKMFVMYTNAAGKAQISMSAVPYDSATDNPTWLTGTVSGAFTNSNSGDFFMRVADNGYAYLFMENQVHKLDGSAATGGANGTVTANSLLFPVTFRMVDAIDWRGNLYIALHQYTNDTRNYNPSFVLSGTLDVGVYVWDRTSTITSTKDFIPMPGVREINKIYISPEGNLRAIVTTSLGFTEVRQYNGATFQTIAVAGFDAFPGFRDSVGALGTMTMWHGRNGVIYLHGKPYPGDKESLFKIYAQSVASTNAGAILVANGNLSTPPAFYVSYTGAGPVLAVGRGAVYTGTGQISATNISAATIPYPVTFLPPMSTLKSITIYSNRGTGSGTTTACTVGVYLNENTSAFASKTVTLDDGAKGYKRIEINKPFVNSVQLELTYPTSTAQGTTDWCPAFAVVEYEPTTDKG